MTGSTKSIVVSLVVVAGVVVIVGVHANEHEPDPWITLKTRIALLTDIDVSRSKISVDTVNGRVTLHGRVDRTEEKYRAAEVANRIEGAIEVRNLLQVMSDTEKPATDVPVDEIENRVVTP